MRLRWRSNCCSQALALMDPNVAIVGAIEIMQQLSGAVANLGRSDYFCFARNSLAAI
jgi:hypothetical protein